ncbi:dienelactone hydrolase family protein [Paraburkholderia sp. BCC1884]|uniref:dienelactone hydrolase family protein n=1 Tax=Paraburkholderia sp. BCC1884 TaxID=2562668 RepID=UPI001182400F|nr:dienelactone hydrolase family protein [Paraburkholderia sp. BCC1884]
MHQETLTYESDGLTMRSQLFYNPEPEVRAGVLVFPEAFGLDKATISRAVRLAELGYVVLACDLHGDGLVVDDLQEAMSMLQPLFDNPARTRARAAAALQALAARPEVDEKRIGAMGFCFPASLELARSGAAIKAAVGFHTGLATKAPVTEAGAIKARVLVCIGADDPFIAPAQRADFESEMRTAKVEWQMHLYGDTVHSFTNPEAAKRNMPHAIRYNAQAATESWDSALDMFDCVLK